MSALQKILSSVKLPDYHKSLWAGPCGAGNQGGITSSLLSRWFACPERFRVKVIEGLAPADDFNLKLFFGSAWHVCEEHAAAKKPWGPPLLAYCQAEVKANPLHAGEIDKWHTVIRAQFSEYQDHWRKHPDQEARVPLLQEQAFDVPYALPGGRTVRLRGKWDSVDLIAAGPNAGVWLQENKTKGRIDQGQLERQLKFDLQTMLYLIALRHEYDRMGWAKQGPIVGVRYNVIRRDAPIKPHQARQLKAGFKPGETAEQFAVRLRDDYFRADPGAWFMRWNVLVSPADVARFRRECLDPALESLADDYEWWAWCKGHDERPYNGQLRAEKFPKHVRQHLRLPYGLYSPVAEGGTGDVDAFIETGSTVGLKRVENLFPELQ